MSGNWAPIAGAASAAFLASLVEFVEALTVVLAIGAVRGWRAALAGAATAVVVLSAAFFAFGPTLAVVDLAPVRLVVGLLVLLFGLRWLHKAILRAAGTIPLHDERQAFTRASDRFAAAAPSGGWDWVGFGGAFQIAMLEGTEVLFIVMAVGGGGHLLAPAAAGAGAALAGVIVLGLTLHRPITRIPENALKCAVGMLLAGFGTFWCGEAVGVRWPGDDWGLPLVSLFWVVLGLALIRLAAMSKGGTPA
jgi:uncharacterized membrane protein